MYTFDKSIADYINSTSCYGDMSAIDKEISLSCSYVHSKLMQPYKAVSM